MDHAPYNPNFEAERQRAGRLDQGDGSASPMAIFSLLGRRKYSIIFTTIVLSALAIALVSTLHSNYVATASVLMQERRSIIADFPNSSGTIATDSVATRTQADILRSADLARTVVRRLNLIERPEFSPSRPGLKARLIEALRPYDPIGLMPQLGLVVPPEKLTLADREELATQTLLGMTTVVNDGKSYVIDVKIKVPAATPEDAPRAAALSAELANAYSDVYTQFTGKVKSDTMRQANGLVDERISALQKKMRAADEAVDAYRDKTGLLEDRAVSGGPRQVTVAGQQLAQLNSDLITASSDRASKEASLLQITQAKAGHGDLQSVPEVVGSPLIQRLREQQVDLGAKEAGLATSRGAGSPDLIAVRGSQRDVANQIAIETNKIAASLRSGVEAARAREAALRAHLTEIQTVVSGQGQKEIKLRELENEADIARVLYSTYLKRSQETATQIDMQEPDALVVSRAGIPLLPAPPTKTTLSAAGVVISVFLSTLIALVRDRMQAGIGSSEQLEASTGIETLGFLPKVRNVHAALRFKDGYSNFAQSIASIRSVLKLKMSHGSQVVMVTSALPEEGKTFFASSLARNAAMAGERVLLIDCDLRRPAVARNIVVSGSVAFQGVTIRRDGFSSLDIITFPSGQGSPQDLFASAQMRHLIGMLRARYDLIMLDAPPILAVSDARVLSTLSDITVLVVCWQRTPQALVNRAASALRSSGAKLVGAVMTQVKLNDLAPADGGYRYTYRPYSK